MAKKKAKISTTAWVIRMTGGTFVLAVLFGLATHFILQEIASLIISFIILFLVILLGVIFDTIGTAAAAAEVAPLNAKASCRVYGARRGVDLVRNAERVANFCNDVVGDITGIISGMVAAVIVFNLLAGFDELEFIIRILLTALVAALTVGGKAIGKKMALSKSTEIMLLSGLFLTHLGKAKALSPGSWPIIKKLRMKKKPGIKNKQGKSKQVKHKKK